jgi:hypothetical protein
VDPDGAVSAFRFSNRDRIDDVKFTISQTQPDIASKNIVFFEGWNSLDPSMKVCDLNVKQIHSVVDSRVFEFSCPSGPIALSSFPERRSLTPGCFSLGRFGAIRSLFWMTH